MPLGDKPRALGKPIIPNRNINFRGNFTHTGYSKGDRRHVSAVAEQRAQTDGIINPQRLVTPPDTVCGLYHCAKVLLHQPVQLPSKILLRYTCFRRHMEHLFHNVRVPSRFYRRSLTNECTTCIAQLGRVLPPVPSEIDKSDEEKTLYTKGSFYFVLHYFDILHRQSIESV